MEIHKNSTWLYVGKPPGKNVEHRVIGVEKDDITTWTVPDKDMTTGGYSWTGTEADFLKNFQPAQLT